MTLQLFRRTCWYIKLMFRLVYKNYSNFLLLLPCILLQPQLPEVILKDITKLNAITVIHTVMTCC